ncbi:MAG: hypothetical protein JWS12_17 [Candidatus Saccharibacteria bacterium]|nr:hypothetical protein [Candidatus Saccharibacteria bacterium]
MLELIHALKQDFPNITFEPSTEFCWSPQQQTITYPKQSIQDTLGCWSLFHELGHAIAGHTTYTSDLELLLLEVSAWDVGCQLAKKYGILIDNDHIQDCLDTYRDWLHQRSTCPTCGNQSLQQDAQAYRCFNCRTSWKVSSSRFCRPYRRLAPTLKTSPTAKTRQAMFH